MIYDVKTLGKIAGAVLGALLFGLLGSALALIFVAFRSVGSGNTIAPMELPYARFIFYASIAFHMVYGAHLAAVGLGQRLSQAPQNRE